MQEQTTQQSENQPQKQTQKYLAPPTIEQPSGFKFARFIHNNKTYNKRKSSSKTSSTEQKNQPQTAEIVKNRVEMVEFHDIHKHNLTDGYLWIHLNKEQSVKQWLIDEPTIDRMVTETLMKANTRPRAIEHTSDGNGQPNNSNSSSSSNSSNSSGINNNGSGSNNNGSGGVLINLRGVNLNPDTDPEDMVSVRMWIAQGLIISVQVEPVRSINNLKTHIDNGNIPKTQAELVANLAHLLLENMGDTIENIETMIDDIEDKVLVNKTSDLSDNIANVRRLAIMLRRYLLPQTKALIDFSQLEMPWMTDKDRLKLKESAEQTTRINEELNEAKDRATIVYEQMAEKRDMQMNRSMLLLAVVSVLFMPMSLISGIFGMNVAGLPWTDNPLGFVFVCSLIFLSGVATALAIKRFK